MNVGYREDGGNGGEHMRGYQNDTSAQLALNQVWIREVSHLSFAPHPEQPVTRLSRCVGGWSLCLILDVDSCDKFAFYVFSCICCIVPTTGHLTYFPQFAGDHQVCVVLRCAPAPVRGKRGESPAVPTTLSVLKSTSEIPWCNGFGSHSTAQLTVLSVMQGVARPRFCTA